MRMIWARRKASPQERVNRLHFVMWDFLRMFLATVICGLAVSLVAAGIALVLAHDAYAASPPLRTDIANAGNAALDAENAEQLQPYPGMLAIGSGCGGEFSDAIERDWKVTIDGTDIDVRVMQTFVVPAGEAMSATFYALLPTGTHLLRLSAHTAGRDWQGKVFNAESYAKLTAVDFRNLTRKSILIVQNDEGAVSTDAIINIAAAEAVVVEYTYRIAANGTQDLGNFALALANGSHPFNPSTSPSMPRGAVWVEWLGTKPTRLVAMPSGATLENSGMRISGLSWAAPELADTAHFRLAWSP